MSAAAEPLPAPAEEHLRALDAALTGPRRMKRELLQEVADHLEDATDAYAEAGYDRRRAAAMAVSDFGTIEETAPAFRTTLAVACSRRTALSLLAALAIQPFLWDSGLELGARAHPGAPSGGSYALLDAGVEVGGFLIVLGAVGTLVATGIGNRWFRAGRRLARATAVFTLVAVTTLPALVATMLLMSPAASGLLWVAAAALMAVPLAAAGLSARRTLAAC